MIEVALTKGPNRQQNILKVLKTLENNILKDLKKLKKTDYITLKPNLITSSNLQATTNIEAVETVLDFLRIHYKGRIIVAEGTSIGSTAEAFHKSGYQNLIEKFQIELLDLNHDEGVTIEAVDKNDNPIKTQISKTIFDSPYTISLSPIKTHNSVILAASIENIVTGSLLKGNKKKPLVNYKNIFRHRFQDYKLIINQTPRSHNLSIAKIFEKITPNLAILDGFEIMERNGPVGGQIVTSGIAIASQNAVAADTIAAYLTGFDPGKIGYLHYLNFSKIEIITRGSKLAECRVKIRPHDSLQEQLKWYNTKEKLVRKRK